ncbi:hypothetical protein A2U01_0064451, partial [Trifolium medium]|nr:hypothetical protein [Trifolium medium]
MGSTAAAEKTEQELRNEI